MSAGTDRWHRRSIRLRGYDYAQPGAYFVTLCVHGQELIFGDISNGQLRMSRYGKIVQACWDNLPHHYAHVELDAFVMMPNHVHGIIRLTDIVGAGLKPVPTNDPASTKRHGLPEIVRAFKTFSARRINNMRGAAGAPVWQRNYYEHIVRNDDELGRIREYVVNNPLGWERDPENPTAIIER
jgi:putative transposase